MIEELERRDATVAEAERLATMNLQHEPDAKSHNISAAQNIDMPEAAQDQVVNPEA